MDPKFERNKNLKRYHTMSSVLVLYTLFMKYGGLPVDDCGYKLHLKTLAIFF